MLQRERDSSHTPPDHVAHRSGSDFPSRTGTNVGTRERWFSAAAGATLIAVGATRGSRRGAWVALAAAPLAYRGLRGRCPAYSALGITTAATADDTREALSGRRGISVRDAVRLERPVEEVYAFWRQLRNLPWFMSHLERVDDLGGNRSRWVARGPAGTRVEWEAEIINEIPDALLAWRSLEGSDVVSAGSVHFDRVRGGSSTQVTVNLQYAPPAGRLGMAASALFGREPSQTIREDLRRFKQLLEAGEVPRTSADTPPAHEGSARRAGFSPAEVPATTAVVRGGRRVERSAR
jgi:uncharacterized membrane protein